MVLLNKKKENTHISNRYEKEKKKVVLFLFEKKNRRSLIESKVIFIWNKKKSIEEGHVDFIRIVVISQRKSFDNALTLSFRTFSLSIFFLTTQTKELLSFRYVFIIGYSIAFLLFFVIVIQERSCCSKKKERQIEEDEQSSHVVDVLLSYSFKCIRSKRGKKKTNNIVKGKFSQTYVVNSTTYK
jgi:hypothetical protein